MFDCSFRTKKDLAGTSGSMKSFSSSEIHDKDGGNS